MSQPQVFTFENEDWYLRFPLLAGVPSQSRSWRKPELHPIIAGSSRIHFTTCDFNSGESVFKIISCHHLLLNIMEVDDILITLNCFGSHWGLYEKTIQAKKIVYHFWKKHLRSVGYLLSGRERAEDYRPSNFDVVFYLSAMGLPWWTESAAISTRFCNCPYLWHLSFILCFMIKLLIEEPKCQHGFSWCCPDLPVKVLLRASWYKKQGK